MAINGISSATSSSTDTDLADLNAQLGATGKGTLDQADFLKLLTVQLASQDPLQPMEDTAFISQMASFSSLQQMQTLSENFTDFTKQQGQINANSYLGKSVTVTDSDGNQVTGTVTTVQTVAGVPEIVINGAQYGLDAVTSVTTAPESTTPTPTTNDASTTDTSATSTN